MDIKVYAPKQSDLKSRSEVSGSFFIEGATFDN